MVAWFRKHIIPHGSRIFPFAPSGIDRDATKSHAYPMILRESIHRGNHRAPSAGSTL
jgi:hypothetical protein